MAIRRRKSFRLEDLRADLEALDARMAADAKQRRRLAAAVAALEALDGPKKKVPKPSPSAARAPTIAAPVGQMQIHEAAIVILQEAGKPLNASVIHEQINLRNLVGRQLQRTSVVSALDRKYHDGELFEKPQPGTYALVSANGGHK